MPERCFLLLALSDLYTLLLSMFITFVFVFEAIVLTEWTEYE
jgi:hypothetical protein